MFRVKLLQPEVDYETGRVIARHEILEGNYREFYDVADKEKEFDLAIQRHRQRRSLDANSYFHVLVSKIADKIGSSNPEVKNRMLALYGQIETDEDGKPIFMIVRDDIAVEKWNELHLWSTSQTQELKGVVYRVYVAVRGSHTYNTKEMSDLISGTVSEALEAGLTESEIISPKEKKMLKDVYGVKI